MDLAVRLDEIAWDGPAAGYAAALEAEAEGSAIIVALDCVTPQLT